MEQTEQAWPPEGTPEWWQRDAERWDEWAAYAAAKVQRYEQDGDPSNRAPHWRGEVSGFERRARQSRERAVELRAA